ncbi:hypothetical protein AAMO2058_001692000 [Amorphochlora amoebiformis]
MSHIELPLQKSSPGIGIQPLTLCPLEFTHLPEVSTVGISRQFPTLSTVAFSSALTLSRSPIAMRSSVDIWKNGPPRYVAGTSEPKKEHKTGKVQ